jgi:hypothetical protein
MGAEMKITITAPYRINPEWSFAPEGQDDGRVWMFIRSGDVSGGLVMSREQAVSLANELLSAAQDAELLAAAKEAS